MNLKTGSIIDQQSVNAYLQQLAQKRTGGAVNFQGIEFQILYAVMVLLEQLDKDHPERYIQLEGLEDIDIGEQKKGSFSAAEYIQLKSSKNALNAGAFWTMGVLQNFFKVYAADPTAKFKLVYNMKITDGALQGLIAGKLNEAAVVFWSDKLNSLGEAAEAADHTDFLRRITFEKQSVPPMLIHIRRLLFQKWHINLGADEQYFKALFYFVFTGSRARAQVSYQDIQILLAAVTDSFSKAPVNLAWQHGWLAPVTYQPSGKLNEDYYEGKAARPAHIAALLPVRRRNWEKQIEEQLTAADAAVIRSSSGQGKSTLAWQVGLNFSGQYQVYELLQCLNGAQVNALAEFLTTRVMIGQRPLLVIDGLDDTVACWSSLAERIAELPVKLLVTARFEDWYRFGADVSKIGLKLVDIHLSQMEAKEIFQQLKQKKKLHPEIVNWQPVWEKVQERGLLIEYVYLLTRGQMIGDRIRQQLKSLNGQIGAAAKLELLRIIAVADCMNLKVETKVLIAYIDRTMRLEQDRAAIFHELEQEYFIRFDHQFVEGLHPVRSAHIKNTLHDFVALSDTLLVIYGLIGEESKQGFFANAAGELERAELPLFYKGLAALLANSSLKNMAMAIDGALHAEPQKYWLQNRALFDQAKSAGGIELFVYDAVPFTDLKILRNMTDIFANDGGGNFRVLADLVDRLPAYSLETSGVFQFAELLSQALAARTMPVADYEGLEFLHKWFKKLGISWRLPITIVPDDLIKALSELPLAKSRELFVYARSVDAKKYEQMMARCRVQIIGLLKKRTDTLTIREDGDDLLIEYFLYEEKMDSANDISVERIRTISAFLPGYSRYRTKAILLPFPSEQLIEVVAMNASKNMTLDAIGDQFEVNMNVIWSGTILKHYAASSVFDWQNELREIRLQGLETIKIFVRFLDSLIEGNRKKQLATIDPIVKQRHALSALLTVRSKYPAYKHSELSVNPHQAELKVIDGWIGRLSNLNNQFQNVINPRKDNDRNIGMINLRAVFFDLNEMQEACSSIEERAFSYFDQTGLLDDELAWYSRLYHTTQYFLEHEPIESHQPKPVAKIAVADWWATFKWRKLDRFKQVLGGIALANDLEIVFPTRLLETDTLTYASFAVSNVDHTDGYALQRLSLVLKPLASLDIHFFTLFFVNNGLVRSGLRFSKDYFEHIGVASADDIAMPIPVIPNEDSLLFLPSLRPVELAADDVRATYVKIVFDLWRLSVCRSKLDRGSTVEADWLAELEDQYAVAIKTGIACVPEDDKGLAFLQWIFEIMEERLYPEDDEFVGKIYEVISW